MSDSAQTPGANSAGFDRDDWLASNSRQVTLASWDERAPAHFRSPDYDVAGLLADPARISDVVRFDLPRLGEIRSQRGVHLQCHIGTDTLSLARLGARMTGVDYSETAISAARELAELAGSQIDYHVCDVYDAPAVLGTGGFDFVFTGIGALCWLPRIDLWAQVVASLLRPGGRLFLRDGHPMLWSLDDPTPAGQLVVEHAYFERAEPTVWSYPGTYVQTDSEFVHNETHEWNHGLGEIITALLDHQLDLVGLVEHDTVPWDALPGLTEPAGHGEYRLRDRPWRLPLSYTLQAVRR
jgi:2-polyprenyl-3-methyl-5-hydroxy-6-metoxy-1,4-benzoquinol methylase